MASETLSKTQIRIAVAIAALSGIVAVAGVSVAWYAIRTKHKAQQKRVEEERQSKAANETRRRLIKSGSKASLFEANATVTRLYVYPVIGLGGASVREIRIGKSGVACTAESAASVSERHNAVNTNNSSSGNSVNRVGVELVSGGGGGIQYDGEWGIFYFEGEGGATAGGNVKPLLTACTRSGIRSSGYALFSCSEMDPSPCHREEEHCTDCSVAVELRSRHDQIVCQIDYEANLLILSCSSATTKGKGLGDTQRVLRIPLDLPSSRGTSDNCGDSVNEHKSMSGDNIHSPTRNNELIRVVEEANNSLLITSIRHEGQAAANWLSAILGRSDVFLARILQRQRASRPRRQQQPCTTTQHNHNGDDKDEEESPLLPSLLSLESFISLPVPTESSSDLHSRSEIEQSNRDNHLTFIGTCNRLADGSGPFVRMQRIAATEDVVEGHHCHYPCPTRSAGKWIASGVHLSKRGNNSNSNIQKITGCCGTHNCGEGKSLADEGNSACSRLSASSGSRSASVDGLSQSSVEKRPSPSELQHVVQRSCWPPHIVVAYSSCDETVVNDSVERWATLQLGGALPGGIGGVILRSCEEKGFSFLQNSGSVKVGDPVWVIARKK